MKTRPSFRERQGSVAPHHRVRSPELLAQARLRSVLAPLHKKLTKWQARSVWISARFTAQGHRPEDRLQADAADLAGEVGAALAAFRLGIDTMPEVRASSRVSDTDRALTAIKAAMEGIVGPTLRPAAHVASAGTLSPPPDGARH